MDKDSMIQKTTEVLSPFETANMMEFLRHLTVKSAITNPWFIGIFLVMAFYAIVVRSKFVLSILFTTISLLLLIHYTMPAEGEGLALSTTIPFAFGGLAIGAVLIYLYFIKTE
jgi:membrane-bound ClpP family serine protease